MLKALEMRRSKRRQPASFRQPKLRWKNSWHSKPHSLLLLKRKQREERRVCNNVFSKLKPSKVLATRLLMCWVLVKLKLYDLDLVLGSVVKNYKLNQ